MELIAKGNTAEVFDYGDDKVLKLFFPDYSNAWKEDSGSYLAVKEKKFKEIAQINKNRKKGK